MNSAAAKPASRPLSEWILIVLVALLPLMKPAVAYPMILSDLVFLALAAAMALDVLRRRLAIRWNRGFLVPAAYVAALAPSLLVTPDWHESAFKLATTAHLASLAVATALVVRDEVILKRVILAWLAATAAVVILAIVSLLTFLVSPEGAIYAYSRSHFGTLPAGHYPRLNLTFFNANMACNYLTVSLGMLLIAYQQSWLGKTIACLLFGGILIAALATLSPGLGGIALAIGMAAFFLWRSRLPLSAGILAAAAALLAAAFTPFVDTTAHGFAVPGTALVLAPAARLGLWTAGIAEFLKHPLIGHGIGVDAVSVYSTLPSGDFMHVSDAHNVFLNVAAQAGLVGLAGLLMLMAYAMRLSRANSVALVLGLTFLNGFGYQGLTGSFEDTRHLWVLFGILIAAARLPLIRRDGNSHRAGAPSPC